MSFKLVDSTKKWMQTVDKDGRKQDSKILFLAEIHQSVPNKGYRIYVAFCDTINMQFYIEELIGGQLHYIDNDLLAEELNAFLDSKQIKTFKALHPWIEQPMVPHIRSQKSIFTAR